LCGFEDERNSQGVARIEPTNKQALQIMFFVVISFQDPHSVLLNSCLLRKLCHQTIFVALQSANHPVPRMTNAFSCVLKSPKRHHCVKGLRKQQSKIEDSSSFFAADERL
jgi:hypothetical protein